jgi:hypothetical protein
MSANDIYNVLRNEGMSRNGALAMLGNMDCESNLQSSIAQRGMTKLTDEQYTEKFNSDPESCIKDAVGYGLCQWTYHTRKRNLRQFAANWGVSVGAEDMQAAFACYELKTDYAQLWNYLSVDCDLSTSTSRICTEFERPAVNNIQARYNAALKWQTSISADIAKNEESKNVISENKVDYSSAEIAGIINQIESATERLKKLYEME